MSHDKKVVFLHVPYPRLVKHAFSKPFIELLSRRFDVKILSPFMIELEDLNYLGLHVNQFIIYDANLDSFQKGLVRIVDYFRRYSYFSRNRNKFNLSTYANLLNSKRYPAILRLVANLAFKVRCDDLLWKLLDNIFFRLYTPKEIRELDFECSLFIQFSNWGINDFIIKNSRFVRKTQKVFFPYTVDQVYATGYFLNNFKRIYCQSQIEKNLLGCLHNYRGSVHIAGSLWYRHVDFLIKNDCVTPMTRNTIVYAGVSSDFFPKKAEVRFVNKIAKQFPKYNVLYLPFFAKNESTDILSALDASIDIKGHETAIAEISANSQKICVKKSIIKFIENIYGASLFVMSYSTSMGLDFAYLNRKKIFSYYYDEYNQVRSGPYAQKERKYIFGDCYSEIDLSCEFDRLDFADVKSPASDRWDSDVNLEKIIEELERIE